MEPFKYFSKYFYSTKLSTYLVKKFIEEYSDKEEFSIEELIIFINREKDKSVKRKFLLENFNEIIDRQWKRERKEKSRREFLDDYFDNYSPESDDTLSKWRKNEPKKIEYRLQLLPYLEEMDVAREMFNQYYFEEIWKKEFVKQIMTDGSVSESLEMGMLSRELSLNPFILSSLRLLSNDINNEVKKSLNKNHRYFVKNIYDFDAPHMKPMNERIVEDIFHKINSSPRFTEISSYHYPSQTEILDKFCDYLKSSIDFLNSDDEYESDHSESDTYREWDFVNKKYKGLKNHRFYIYKKVKYKWFKIAPILKYNTDLEIYNRITELSSGEKISQKVIKIIQNKMVQQIIHRNIYPEVIYVDRGRIEHCVRRIPSFKDTKIKKNLVIKKYNSIFIKQIEKIRFRIIKYYFKTLVTPKSRILKIRKTNISRSQKLYNHFKIQESFDKRIRRRPNLLKQAEKIDYFKKIGDVF